jgi:CheY-like chemotaxis protein
MHMANRAIARHTVLIVDDEPGVLDVWARILLDEGYRVARACDAFDAVGMLASNRPTVAICNLHLPGPSGVWLAKMIRQHCPKTAVVLASGDPSVPHCAPLHEAVVACVPKPVCRDQLLAAVRIGIGWASERTTTLN